MQKNPKNATFSLFLIFLSNLHIFSRENNYPLHIGTSMKMDEMDLSVRLFVTGFTHGDGNSVKFPLHYKFKLK